MLVKSSLEVSLNIAEHHFAVTQSALTTKCVCEHISLTPAAKTMQLPPQILQNKGVNSKSIPGHLSFQNRKRN